MAISRLWWLCLLVVHPLQATEVYRCTNAHGQLLFSQKPCGPDAVIETVDDHTKSPDASHRSRSAKEQLENYRREVKKIEKITGKSRKPAKHSGTMADECDQVGSLTLRNARISRDIMKCHTMDDVRDIYGEPKSVSTWSDRKSYDTRWTFYKEQPRQRVNVYFKQGRVVRWNTRKYNQ